MGERPLPEDDEARAREALCRFLDLLAAEVAERLMAGPDRPQPEESGGQAEEAVP